MQFCVVLCSEVVNLYVHVFSAIYMIIGWAMFLKSD